VWGQKIIWVENDKDGKIHNEGRKKGKKKKTGGGPIEVEVTSRLGKTT